MAAVAKYLKLSEFPCKNRERTLGPTSKTPGGQDCNNLNNITNEKVLDYNPKYKINI